MADSPQTSEELPIAGKWWRDELKGCESTQVLEPSRRPKPHENNRNKETISFFCNPRTFVTGAYNFSYLKPPNKIFRSAPTIVEGYIAWLDRVQQDFGSLWKDFGIFDFIQLSRLGLKYQQEMIIAALHFFDSSTNTFQFECGMMTPTLFDVAAITGLPPTGDTYDPTLAGSKIEPKIRTKSYTKYIEEQNQLKGEVSDEEHVAFLVLWLSQHIFCTRSLQVAKMFLPMAIQLHEGQQFSFGKLILGCLYENMRSVCENIKQTGDGSTFLGSGQFWLNATFRVEMDLFLPDLHNEEVAKRQIEGVRLARLIPRTRGSGQFWLNATFRVEMDLFLPDLHNEEVAKRQIEGVRLARLIPRTRALLTPTIISCRFGLKSTEFGLVGYFPNFVSRQFGLTQLLPKTIYLHERDICLGYYGMTEPQFYALLKKFEGLEYELTPFHFELSHAQTVDFSRWWNLHYESQMVDVVVLRSAIEAGFNAQAIRKIKSTLNARGSRSKAESNSLAKPPFPPVKTEPGATTRKRAATAEAGGPSKKARPEEIVVIDDDVVVEVEEKQSTLAPKASNKNRHPESELRRKRKHEQPEPLLEETHTTPSEKKEKKEKKRKKKKNKDSKGKKSPPKDGVPTDNVSIPEQASPVGEEQTGKKRRKKKKKDKKSHSQSDPSVTNTSKLNLDVNEESKHQKTSASPVGEEQTGKKRRKKKKKDKKSHSQSDPSVTNTSKLNLDVNEESKHQKTSVDPDSTPKKTSASHNPKHTNLGQGGLSSTVLVPEVSPDSIVKTVVDELKQQLEHTGEGELSPMTKAVEDTGVLTRDAVSNLSETSPPKTSTEVELTIEAESSKAGQIKDLGNSFRETLPTIPEQTTPKNSNEFNPEVVGTSSKTKELDSSGVEKEITEDVDNQASKNDNLAGDTTHIQVNPPVKETIAAQTNPDPPLTKGPMMEFSRPLGEDNAEVTKVAENVEEEMSDKGEHSSTKYHHPSKSGNEDEGLTIDLNKQIETRAKHFDLTSQGNAEVNALKAASASAFLQISACEDNIARWKSEIRELECKIGQEEEKKKQLEAQAVEVPKATIEEKAKTWIHHYSEALRDGVEMDRLAGEKNAVQRKLTHIKSLYDQFRQAHI
ncbi:hypothetical protein TSUD_96750 [Trifolium subterraneum]|nr:hypothetical protein TSUD_96750 [Trifolium subterraneum]